MRKRKLILAVMAILTGPALVSNAYGSGIVIYKDGDKYVKMGGRIQLQYHKKDPDGTTSTDEIFFRRLRPYIEGSLHKDWKAKFQWDMGKAEDENELAIKDAYFQYKGVKNVKITAGNANFPFSREFLTSSKKQQLVERTFVGDHNYGTPDRNVGLHITGATESKKVTYGFSFASASLDPDSKKLDFDTPVNKNADFNEGWMYGGRIDFHPLGHLKFAQGDFKRETKFTIGVAAFSWNNDDDNNTRTTGSVATTPSKADVDSVDGIEISGAFRGGGFSVDYQINKFDADLIDRTVTNGIFRNGTTELKSNSIEAGYMVIPGKLEIVAGISEQDADNYAETWERTAYGINWFLKKHDIKVQLTFRDNENVDGVKGKNKDEVFLQTQFVF